LALGVMPWFNALMCGELLWLLLAPVRRWRARDSGGFDRMVLLLTIFFAALQSYGLAIAFDQIDGLVPVTGDVFIWPAAVTLFAASMLTVLMANLISREGIGSGFWVVFLAQTLFGLPGVVASVFAGVRSGDYAAGSVLAGVLAMVAAVALTVAVLRQRTDAGLTDHAGLVWPALLGTVLAGWIFTYVSMRVVSDDGVSTFVQAGHPVHEVIIAVMIVLAAWRYGAVAGFASLGFKTGVMLAMIAVVLPPLGLPPFISGSDVIIAVTVLFSFAQVWQTAGKPGMPPGVHNRPDAKTL
jgi:preprotein translocase subunit SecY